MKAPTQSLAMVLELALRKRDQALQALGQAQQQHEQAIMQMNQLKGYTAESQQRWRHRATLGISPTLLRTQQTFMAKLDHAVSFQDGVLNQMVHDIQRCQRAVVEAERELASLQKVQERRVHTWQKARQQHDQRTNDEIAANQHRQHAQAHSGRTPS
jgi:flagellar FliJ protein